MLQCEFFKFPPTQAALKGDLRPKLSHNFNDSMEKEPCTKFCGILISSREVMKLQSLESGLSDVTSTNVQNISPLACFA